MLGLDIFGGDAFSAFELTGALNRVDHIPRQLGALPIFDERPVRTIQVGIELVGSTLQIIPITTRGSPPSTTVKDRGNVRDFRTVRIAQQDTIYAHELQGMRAFGSLTELAQAQDETLARMVKLRNNIEATLENMRLGAVQGILYDSDNSTVVYNWFTEFGITQPAEIDFDLDNPTPASGAIRAKTSQVVRAIMRAAKGSWIDGRSYVMGLCGDTFFDQLSQHVEVRNTYLNQSEAGQLRNIVGNVFGVLRYGDIVFVNYRGSDDNSAIAIPPTKCKFFPVDAPGAFEMAFAPYEGLDFVNTLGKPWYALTVPDRDRNQWVSVEVYSYPLAIATHPAMLQSARNT